MILLLYVLVLLWVWSMMKQALASSPAAPDLCRRLAVVSVAGPLAVTILIAFSGADRASTLRFRLFAIRVKAVQSPAQLSPSSQLSQPVEIQVGGSREIQGLWVARLPEQFAAIRSDPAAGRLSVRYTAPGAAGVIGISRERDPHWTLLGEVALAAGDRIRVGGGARAAEVEIVDERTVRAAGVELRLPLSNKLPIGEIYIPVTRFRGVRERVFPVSAILEEAAARGVAGATAAADLRLASFLFHKPTHWGFGGKLYLALLDAAVTVNLTDGRVVKHRLSDDLPLTSDGPLTLYFCSLGSSSQLLEPSSPPSAKPDEKKRWIVQLGIRPLLSGRILMEQGPPASLVFYLNTPQTLSFSRDLLLKLRAADDKKGSIASGPLPARMHLSLGGELLVGRSVAFTLPKPFGAAGQAILEPSGNTLRVLTPAGEMKTDYGQPFWLGDRFQGLVQVDRIGPGLWALAGIAAIAVGVLAVLLSSGIADPRFIVLLAGVESIASLRVLLGFQAYNKYPADFKSYALAIFVFAFLPWTLVVVRSLLPDARPISSWRWLNLVCAAPPLAIAVGAFSGWTSLALGSMAVAPLAIVWLPWALCERLGSVLKLRVGLAEKLIAARPVAAMAAVVAPAALMAILRVLGALAGIRERLPTEPPIALSTFYTLACILGYSVLAAIWAYRNKYPFWAYSLSWLGYWSLAFAVPGVFASDLGLLLLSLPICADFWFRWVDRFGVWRSAGAALLLLTIGVTTLLFGFGGENSGFRLQDRNVLRLVAAFRPGSLPERGDLDSENLAIMLKSMDAYVHSGGKGYLGADVHPVIRATALREHVPSVFVGGNFGLVGMVALFLMYALPVALALNLDPRKQVDFRCCVLVFIGRFALLVFGLVSMYMTLANANVAVFTGKNAYLLGLDSISDLLEGGAILLAAVWCLGRVDTSPLSKAGMPPRGQALTPVSHIASDGNVS